MLSFGLCRWYVTRFKSRTIHLNTRVFFFLRYLMHIENTPSRECDVACLTMYTFWLLFYFYCSASLIIVFLLSISVFFFLLLYFIQLSVFFFVAFSFYFDWIKLLSYPIFVNIHMYAPQIKLCVCVYKYSLYFLFFFLNGKERERHNNERQNTDKTFARNSNSCVAYFIKNRRLQSDNVFKVKHRWGYSIWMGRHKP